MKKGCLVKKRYHKAVKTQIKRLLLKMVSGFSVLLFLIDVLNVFSLFGLGWL